MKKILTWIKPTWSWMHIWNYFWAVKPLIDLSKTWNTYLFIADYHSLTSVHDKDTLKENIFNIMCEYFALLWEDTNITIFRQSSIKRINDITWILSSVTPYSLMLRSHAFKDANQKNSEINMATFNYPILMTSDIISYDTDIVPIWKDQIQHIEFARDIAWYFNKTYKKEIFKLPEYHIEKNLQTIIWTDGRKMSKSYKNTIPIFESEKKIKEAIMKIKTDDTPLDKPKDYENCLVFSLIKLFSDEKKQEEIKQKYKAWWYWYWHAKLELLELFLEYFKAPRERYLKYKKNPSILFEKLEQWNKKANDIVDRKYEDIKEAIWL